jgi:hypothetical protein
MHLVSVFGIRNGPVISDGQGKKMEHHIGPFETLSRAQETTGFEMVCRSGTPSEEPLKSNPGSSQAGKVWLLGDWQLRSILNVDL